MKKSNKILFFGNERLATGVVTNTPIVRSLIEHGYIIEAIVVPASKTSPSRKTRPLEIAAFAKEQGIELLELNALLPNLERLKSFNAEVGVLAAFGKLVPQEVIDIFPYGIINIHPSLLPLHRGTIPIEAVILSGEKQTGVSLMKLVKQMDAGPLYDQTVLSLSGNESKQELADRLGALGSERLIKVLPQILGDQLKPKPQNGNQATYDSRLHQSQAVLDFSKSKDALIREIRAFKGWPRSRSAINGDPIIIVSAHSIGGSNDARPGEFFAREGELAVATSDGILIIDRLIPSGGKEMSGNDYLRGRRLN